MKGAFRFLNVGSFIALGAFLGALPILSTSSGHIQSITCYECRACASRCPFKFDPAGFLLAGRTNNPQRRMLVQLDLRKKKANGEPNPTGYNQLYASLRPEVFITMSKLYKRDKYLRVKVRGKEKDRIITVKEAVEQGYSDEQLLETYEMRAVDAAFFCILCGNCDDRCPIDLPVTEYIRDLKENGKF
jgi:ferredoxin